MARVRYNTNIEEDLLRKAKEKAAIEGLDGANAIIEKALKVYFANCAVEVWEKPLKDGWFKKLVVRPGRVVIECVRSRKVKQYKADFYTDEVLQPKGWKQVWKMKKPQTA